MINIAHPACSDNVKSFSPWTALEIRFSTQASDHVSVLDIVKDSIKPYNMEDSNSFKSVVEFEGRGVEPIDFEPRVSQNCSLVDTHVKYAHNAVTPQHLVCVEASVLNCTQ